MPFVDSTSMAYIIRFMKEATGVSLTLDKAYLVESRLKGLGSAKGIQSLDELCRRMPSDEDLRKQVLDAMTTHETFFFRDPQVFETFGRFLSSPQVQAKPIKRLRIWSAACSSGQEPYTLAILLMEKLGGCAGWDARIVATDLAEATLDLAREGLYNPQQTNRGLPTPLLLKWFVQEGRHWRVKPELKRLVEFKKLNLLQDPPPFDQPFDAVLCRNVLIYFDPTDSLKVVVKARAALAPGGLFAMGSTENLLGREEGFETWDGLTAGVYRRL